jgi:hypothetical protein
MFGNRKRKIKSVKKSRASDYDKNVNCRMFFHDYKKLNMWIIREVSLETFGLFIWRDKRILR